MDLLKSQESLLIVSLLYTYVHTYVRSYIVYSTHVLDVFMLWLDLHSSVATGSGHPDHPGQPDHILPGSTGSDPLYKISGSDLDFA